MKQIKTISIKCETSETLEIAEMTEMQGGLKERTDIDYDKIKLSICKFGFSFPFFIWKSGNKNYLIDGHGRFATLCKMQKDGYIIPPLPVVYIQCKNKTEAKQKLLRLNSQYGKMTKESVLEFAEDIELDFDEIALPDTTIDFTDAEETDTENVETTKKELLSNKFIVPPFDIFDAKKWDWLKRKRYWNAIINDKAQARADVEVYSDNMKYEGHEMEMPTVSILDPVLSEIVCHWYTPNKKSEVFDVFAGDTVFGYVSATLGHNFKGIELRKEQADFNNERTKGMTAKYYCDDGRNVLKHIKENTQDLLFSCPPYYDLEVYSDLENDASNQETYEDFYKILDEAFSNAIKCLKNDRFAVIVCGDIRNKKTGGYYNFPNDIINTFKKNGMLLYNNIKLLTPLGTAMLRAGKYMVYRKTAHIYQDVLVFYKGDQKNIKNVFPIIEVKEFENEGEDLEQE